MQEPITGSKIPEQTVKSPQSPEETVKSPESPQNNQQNRERGSTMRKSVLVRKRKDAILTWKDLGYEVTVKVKKGFLKHEKKPLTILSDMNGYVKSGECLAIIGGSGAGKSSFMNLLSDRIKIVKETKITGSVEINNQPMSYEKFKHVIGFVMQTDIFLEHLTVKEYFKFAIDLRATNLSEEEKMARLENGIAIMKLERAQDNYVGGVYRKGISGGEKKRLNIGFELLGDPSIIFLDEPTSGLDSYTSFIIMNLLRQISKDNNIIVVYTIHQPSIETFNLFDNLLILDRGRNIYFGKAKGAIDYYAQLDYPVPENTNPANHFITLALRGPERNEAFYNNYKTFILPSVLQEIDKNSGLQGFEVTNKIVGPFEQYKILLVRAFKNFVRNPMSFIIRLVQICFLICIFCMLFFRMSDDFTNPVNISNREGAFFFLGINLFISYFQNYLLTCNIISS